MAEYDIETLENFSREELALLEQGDVIRRVKIKGFMSFSSYTGMAFSSIGNHKLVISGYQEKEREESLSVYVIRSEGHGPIISSTHDPSKVKSPEQNQ